jgi:hypothetical protein
VHGSQSAAEVHVRCERAPSGAPREERERLANLDGAPDMAYGSGTGEIWAAGNRVSARSSERCS